MSRTPYDEDLLQYGIEAYNVIANVRAELRRTGFREFPTPNEEGEPTTPADIGIMTDRELGLLYDQFGQWYDFLTQQVIIYEACVKQAKQILQLAEDSCKKDLTGSVESIKTQARTSQEYLDANGEFLEYEIKLACFKDRRSRINNALTRISRHITLRMEAGDKYRRGQNVQSYRPKRPRPKGAIGG